MTDFKKAALEGRDPDACPGDGYGLILQDVEQTLYRSQGKALSVEAYLKGEKYSPCVDLILKNPRQKWVAREFIQWMAGRDEKKKDLSLFDVFSGYSVLYGDQFHEKWEPYFTDTRGLSYSPVEKIRAVGLAFLAKESSKAVKSQSLLLLQSLVSYLSGLPPSDPAQGLGESLDYFWNQKEPQPFADYLQVPYSDFLRMDESQKRDLFKRTVHLKFPDAALTETLFKYLTRAEAVEFSKICFRENLRPSLVLFETVSLPKLYSLDDTREIASGESAFFPNLPQDHPYADRQKQIDDFLGKPVLVQRTNFWQAAAQGARTTVKKYVWPFDTEVFSIDSGKPGPTTLVFSPHFHEDNPRKMFHWIKDIPLKTGRILLIPEANRAMYRLNKDTNPMNGLFDESLTHDGLDYLVVRRTEYLMGLVDGMVGLHDAHDGPYYISDLLATSKAGNTTDPGPIASPYVPSDVKNIQDILRNPSGTAKVTPQTQWQIAQFSRERLEKLYGEKFSFRPETISGTNSHSADSATGYMNFHLGKPAMTFEGNKAAEHGQLQAMALYTLLLGFGHEIDPSFEDVLKKTQPTVDKGLYEGLPVTGEPTKRKPAAPAAPTPAGSVSPNVIPLPLPEKPESLGE